MHDFLVAALPVVMAAGFALVGWVWRQDVHWRRKHSDALTAQSAALAVLVAESKPTARQVRTNDSRISDLERSTAVLREQVRQHGHTLAKLDRDASRG